MSSGPSEQHRQDESASEKRASGAHETATEGLTRATECPSCGTPFASDYCPSCGQAADPPISATAVVGGFFRELFDIENGFWPTLVGLTLRPGNTLRRYLEGARAGLASPGRYLLASVIIGIGINRFLAWTGMGKDPFDVGASSGTTGEGGPADGGDLLVEALFTAIGQWEQFFGAQIRTLSALLMAVLLGALLFRLFGERLSRAGEALTLGAFLSGHLELLNQGAKLLCSPAVFLWTGQPLKTPSFLLTVVIQVGFVGFTAHRCFGPGWRPGLKGAFAAGWALIEGMAISWIFLMGHAGWLALTRPERFGMPEGAPAVAVALFAGMGILSAVPLLLHAGAEAYYRLR
ncbi:DUF3667 domain-containing protein [Salinibacter ruber]|uniref:DUF3667 domain-containing protein n=1 Tax=Salinibacter ruber TaxID=146919 RepID=UPI002155F38F|nr:DUF3667 domain-containing protein [Salinibacter ruber]MCS3610062.1 hypothetical protein [Salinibacter ruber]MCS3648120.1 hypothetical protein [Salinibacter ruber]